MSRHINLIPASTRRRQAVQRVVRLWSTVVAAIGVVAAVFVAQEWARGVAAADRFHRLEIEFAPLASLLDQQRSLREAIGTLTAQEDLSLRLSHGVAGLEVLGAVAEAARGTEGAVFVETLDYLEGGASPAGALVGAGGAPLSATPGRSVTLVGVSRSGLEVAEFAKRLREGGLFASVEVASTRPLPTAQPGSPAARHREFEIRCAL